MLTLAVLCSIGAGSLEPELFAYQFWRGGAAVGENSDWKIDPSVGAEFASIYIGIWS